LGERYGSLLIKKVRAMISAASDIAFTPAVKAVQTRRGSRDAS
jgi:hypothetical protein